MSTTPFSIRGFTLQDLPEGDYAFDLVDWMAAHHLNRLEIRMTGGHIAWPSAEFPELCMEDAAKRAGRLKALIQKGRECGVRVLPAIGHADGMTSLVKQHPEWKAHGVIPHPTGMDLNKYNVCFSHPGVEHLYKTIVWDLVDAVEPDEVQFWLTENGLWCNCPRCKAEAGEDAYSLTEYAFRKQAGLFRECVRDARQDPPLEISQWTTQGSRPHNVSLLQSLPKDVLWFYYDGERRGCYNLRRREAIPSEMADLAKEGYRIGVQPDWCSCGRFLTSTERILEICRETAEKGLLGVSAWVPEHALNLDRAHGGGSPVFLVAAQAALDPLGCSIDTICSVMHDAAVDAGHDETVAAASGEAWKTIDAASRVIHLSDCYAYWWHGVNQPGAICERIIRSASTDELDQRWTDETWDVTLPGVDAAVAEMERLAIRLNATDDPSGYLDLVAAQVRLITSWGKVCRWVLWAGIVWHRMGGWDTSHGPWRDDREELLNALTLAQESLRNVEAGWIAGLQLVAHAGRPHHWSRAPVLADQLAKALEAARHGACPAALPRQDAYPYL